MAYRIDEDSAAAAASKAIHKTIEDVESLLDGLPLKDAGKLRTKLREVFIRGFNDVGKLWYKRGFNRGHREAHQEFRRTGDVPKRLSTDVCRTFVAAGGKQEIKLRSTIKQRKKGVSK